MPADDTTGTSRPTGDYGAKDIQVLEGLDPVRKRPGMYIGSTGLAGLHHLIWEVVDNSVDEAMAGFCTRIGVTLQADGGCRVDDNGRGIPVDPYPSGPHKGKSAAEVVLTVLHAGGKFGGQGYKVSGGLHGVGVSVVNALSERLLLEVDRGGKRYRQEFAKGGKPQGKMEVVGSTPARGRKTGSTVTFWPDPTIFVAEGIEFVSRTVLERLQTMAFLNRGLEIVFTDERPEKEQQVTYQYKGGLVDFVKHLNASKEALFAKVCHYEDSDEEHQTLDIAIQWNTGYYEGIHGYANGISTTEGGMHVEGFRTALTTVVNKYARAEGAAQGEGRQPARRGHPRGVDGDRLGEAARSAVRGPDQGQARQRPDALVRPEGDQRAPRRVARGEPDRGEQGRQEGASPRRKPGSRRRTPATPSVARRRCRARACRTS